MANCPYGCPCPVYTCSESTTTALTSTTVPETTTTTSEKVKNKVLTICTSGCRPVMTDFNGLFDNNILFLYGEATHIYRSCALTFENRFYIFGGNKWSRQLRGWSPGQ